MYTALDLIIACLVTALGTHTIYLVPRALDRRRARRTRACVIPGPHNGPCQPHPGGPS